jgi:hypothetical protein
MREQALIAQTFNHWHTRVTSRTCAFNWQDAAVQYILDTVVSSLAADESRRFTWSEQGFFQVRTDVLNMQRIRWTCNPHVGRSLRSTLVLGKPGFVRSICLPGSCSVLRACLLTRLAICCCVVCTMGAPDTRATSWACRPSFCVSSFCVSCVFWATIPPTTTFRTCRAFRCVSCVLILSNYATDNSM